MKSRLENNLAYLRHANPALHEKFSAAPMPASVTVVEAKSGAATMRALRADGSEVAVHSAYDPLREASEFAAAKVRDDTEAYAVVGVGLGYHVDEMIRKLSKKKWLLLIEARDDVFRAALEYGDLSRILARDRTRLFVGHTWSEFLGWLKTVLDDSNVDNISVIMHAPSVSLLPEFYRNILEEMSSAVNRRAVEVVTLVKQAKTLETNAILNLPAVARSAGVKDFAGAFGGMPMIVVGAGPSLDKNLELLRQVKGKAPIICVGKVLKLLLSRGIRPEFTANLDMLSSSLECFKDAGDLTGVSLVYDPDSYHEIVRGYSSDLVTFETIVPLTTWFSRFTGEKGSQEKGLSVAHTAFYFARATGADPIVLVGVDLAVIGEFTHALGSTRTWGGKVSDVSDPMIDIPASSGGTVRAFKSFLSFVTAFEVEIGRTKSRVINCTDGGAKIRGAVHRDFASTIAEFCAETRPIDRIVGDVLRRERRFDRAGFTEAAARILGAGERVVDRCRQSRGWIRRIAHLDLTNRFDREEYEKLAARVNDARQQVLRETELLPFLQRLVSDAALYIKAVTKALDDVDANNAKEKTRLESQRMEAFFKAYEEASIFFMDHFRRVVDEVVK